jgi:excinuclease ABC subunit C
MRSAGSGAPVIWSALEELRERLRLPTLPRRIECCDISHLGSGDTVNRVARDRQPERSFTRLS